MTYPVPVSAALLAFTLIATSFVPSVDQVAHAAVLLQTVA